MIFTQMAIFGTVTLNAIVDDKGRHDRRQKQAADKAVTDLFSSSQAATRSGFKNLLEPAEIPYI